MVSQIFIFLSAGIVSLLITYPLLWLLKFFKITQSIREEGPPSHREKAGTITAGGLGIILTIILLTLILIDIDLDLRYLALILLTLGYAAVGLSDDLLKSIRHENLGLTFWQKITLQTALAGFFSIFVIALGHHQTVTGILKLLGFNLSTLYFLLSTLMIVGTANASNLTDGLDGLLAGVAGVAFLAFAILSNRLGFQDAAIFSLIASGATFAFLCFNFPRAKAFMGDVGSLALGAGLAGIAVLIHKELLLILIGGIFVAEALSVILQVASYKLFRKRIFKMTPLHHHFELWGWSQVKVVVVFWIVAVILGLICVII